MSIGEEMPCGHDLICLQYACVACQQKLNASLAAAEKVVEAAKTYTTDSRGRFQWICDALDAYDAAKETKG